MAILVTVAIIVVGVLLGLVILVQNPKGGGLATGFGGAAQIGGVQKTTDFLEKATWYLAIGFMALCLLSAKFSNVNQQVGVQEGIQDDSFDVDAPTGDDTATPDFDGTGAGEVPTGE